METISFEEFMSRTMGGRPNQMNVGPYVGHSFSCACGNSHSFSFTTQVLRELPQMRLVLTCPDDPSQNTVTCVKMKGFFRFKGFESLFGVSQQELGT